MNQHRIEGRDWSGEGAWDSEPQNWCGDRHGKFRRDREGSTEPFFGKPDPRPARPGRLRSVRKEGGESAGGIVAGAHLCPAKARAERPKGEASVSQATDHRNNSVSTQKGQPNRIYEVDQAGARPSRELLGPRLPLQPYFSKTIAPLNAPTGCQRPKITAARAIKPRPPVMF